MTHIKNMIVLMVIPVAVALACWAVWAVLVQ